MGGFKLGRLPATRPAALADISVYAIGKLPAPPASVAVPNVPYPIDGNATYGDCVAAGIAHLIAAWNKEDSEHDTVPNGKQVVAEYFKLTGGVDSGLVEADVLNTWHVFGLFGEKIAGYAPVNPTSLLGLHQGVAFYGGLMLGIQCPLSAQQQFENGQEWTYVAGSPIEGGHCVVALGYGPNGGLHCATWGGIAVLSAGFLAHYLEEAWVILPHQLVEAKKDQLGIDLATLQADLARV